jgi:cysteine desulfurase/selenocysteine lyase
MKDIRKDFPILRQKVGDKPLIYFDSAATSQRPQSVIDTLSSFYAESNANIHRGIHLLSERATELYEQAREKIACFIRAADACEVIFTRGTTEGVNLVAETWGMENLKAGDEILVTEMEHHANLLPWQRLAKRTGATLKFIPVTADGKLAMDKLDELITPKTKLVAVTHASNVLGTHVDVKTIGKKAHAVGAKILVDAAQSIPHEKIDVKDLDCDFLAFSGHKMLGPTGIGVLYIKKELHANLPPYQVGGGIVYEVDFHDARWQEVPQRFEAGTPAIAQAVGLGAAVDYMNKHINFDDLKKHESALTKRAIEGLAPLPKIRLFGPLEDLKKSGHLVNFVVDGMHAHDVSEYLNSNGIAVRAGHHCAQPLAKKLGVPASVRASFYGYNTLDEVDQFVNAMTELVTD